MATAVAMGPVFADNSIPPPLLLHQADIPGWADRSPAACCLDPRGSAQGLGWDEEGRNHDIHSSDRDTRQSIYQDNQNIQLGDQNIQLGDLPISRRISDSAEQTSDSDNAESEVDGDEDAGLLGGGADACTTHDESAGSVNSVSEDVGHNDTTIQSYGCGGDTHSQQSYQVIDLDSGLPDPDSSLQPLCVSAISSDSASSSGGHDATFRDRFRDSRRNRKSSVIRAKWSSNPTRIEELDRAQLPCLWRIHTRHRSAATGNRSSAVFRRQYCRKLDTADVTRTPIVLTAMRKSSKVYASMIRLDPDQAAFKEVGPQIVIPVNYPGWFQYVENSDVSVHSVRTIGDVASAELGEFLVHSPITAYRYAKRSGDGDKLYSKVEIAAGEVLTTRSVLTEWLSDESLPKGCFCTRRKYQPDASYLKVRDSSSRRLLVPFETEGGFSEVGQRGGETRPDASYQLTDIARWVQMPVELKLVCGQLPDGLDQYTGLFRLEQLSFESSVFGCTTAIRKGVERQMVEFPVDVDLEFVQNKNWTDLRGTDEVHSVLLECQNTMEEFVTSMKIVKDMDPEPALAADSSRLDHTLISTMERSLPPTPLLPSSAKSKKFKGWSWAKSLLMKYRKVHKVHDVTPSENSDYEVIPFYLRALNNQREDDRSAALCETLERTNFAQFNSACDLSETDKDSMPVDTCTLPSSPPPPPKFKVRHTRPARLDCSHDEDGYLLPVEVRESFKDRLAAAPQSPRSGKDASLSYRSVGQDTCSSATITRELNKSTETLMPPPSSGTLRTCGNSVSELDYSSPAHFDKQRLDAFLSDSLHELRRRQSRELLTQISELSEQRLKPAACPTCAATAGTAGAPSNREPLPESHNDVNHFLDKIFDCDRMSSEEGKGQSSNSGSTTTGAQTRRSLSVPETAPPRLDHVHRGSRQCLECGYQTLDSGIWLSPRSGASDPYRQDRDSAIYRSTSDCSWVPPEKVDALTVEEVGLSLRYIGMKDYIVTRFYEEQIDGKQLAELTTELLTEGFPELNALDRKKLGDFVKGWRPKKWGYISAE